MPTYDGSRCESAFCFGGEEKAPQTPRAVNPAPMPEMQLNPHMGQQPGQQQRFRIPPPPYSGDPRNPVGQLPPMLPASESQYSPYSEDGQVPPPPSQLEPWQEPSPSWMIEDPKEKPVDDWGGFFD